MSILRTFLVLLASGTLATGTSACGEADSGDSDATTTTDVGPSEVEDPGDGEDVPADPNAPATNPGGVNY